MYPRTLLCGEIKIEQHTSSKKELFETDEEAIYENPDSQALFQWYEKSQRYICILRNGWQVPKTMRILKVQRNQQTKRMRSLMRITVIKFIITNYQKKNENRHCRAERKEKQRDGTQDMICFSPMRLHFWRILRCTRAWSIAKYIMSSFSLRCAQRVKQ